MKPEARLNSREGNRLQTESEHVMTKWGPILIIAQLLAGDTCCAQ
jgi:hypothetical protein